MPDPGSSPGQALIRHPEVIELTGFPDKSENDVFKGFSTFYEIINFSLFPNREP